MKFEQQRALSVHSCPLERVLILSYFFPPCNLAASNRAAAWAGGLAQQGLYPVVVTRSWDVPVKKLEDVTIASGHEVVVRKNTGAEIHFLPYRPLLKDRWKPAPPLSALKKALSMATAIFQHLSWRTSEYAPFYLHSLKLLNEGNFKAILVTGNPWGMFRIAHDLSKASGVPWIADYRDIWTATRANVIGLGLPYKVLFGIEHYFERALVQKAIAFTSISEGLVTEIEKHVQKRGQTVLNGFVEDEIMPFKGLNKYEKFTITYVGTLYNGQDIAVFAKAITGLIDEYRQAQNISVNFLGAGFNAEQAQRLKALFEGYEGFVSITDRTSRAAVLRAEAMSHILLHVGWAGHTGIVGSKIYEYMALGSPILICPTDGDVLEEMMKHTGAGFCAKDENEAYEFLKRAYELFVASNPMVLNRNEMAIQSYSRTAQTRVLANFIKETT